MKRTENWLQAQQDALALLRYHVLLSVFRLLSLLLPPLLPLLLPVMYGTTALAVHMW